MGVILFETDKARFTTVIACSKEAKARGVKNVMRTPEALALCPDLVLVMQRPDLFRRAHNALLNEIGCEIPIDTVKSIDELTCRLGARHKRAACSCAAAEGAYRGECRPSHHLLDRFRRQSPARENGLQDG
ncbi:MAG: hypothetical protein R3C51_12985 [Parvularculaceae bacterium]